MRLCRRQRGRRDCTVAATGGVPLAAAGAERSLARSRTSPFLQVSETLLLVVRLEGFDQLIQLALHDLFQVVQI